MSDYEKLAERCIRQIADDLTADLRKRCPAGTVEIWIGGAGRPVTACLRKHPKSIGFEWANGATIEACVAEASRLIANLPMPTDDTEWIRRSYEAGFIGADKARSLLREIGVNGAPWLTEAA